MLYNGKKAIIEAIKKDAQKKALFENFKKQITESKSLSLEYVIQEEVNKYAGKLNLDESALFVKHLKNKFEAQIQNTEYDFKAKNNLFESFGVDKEKIKKSKYDSIIDFSTKTINENVVIGLVSNPKKTGFDDTVVKEIMVSLKESYEDLIPKKFKPKSLTKLNNRIKLIESYSKHLSEADKTAVQKCIETIKTNAKDDFRKSVNQAFKLNVMVESLVFAKERTYLKEDSFDDQEEALEKKLTGGKKYKIANVENLYNIIISNTGERDGLFEIEFKFDFYPTEPTYRDRFYEVIELKEQATKLKRQFNTIINSAFPGHFSTDMSQIEAKSREQLMDKDFEAKGGKTNMKIEYFCHIIDPLTREEIASDFPGVLQQIANVINKSFVDVITPEMQQLRKQEFIDSGATRGKSTNLASRKYVAKTEDQKKAKRDNRAYDDEWAADMFLSGTIGDDGLDD